MALTSAAHGHVIGCQHLGGAFQRNGAPRLPGEATMRAAGGPRRVLTRTREALWTAPGFRARGTAGCHLRLRSCPPATSFPRGSSSSAPPGRILSWSPRWPPGEEAWGAAGREAVPRVLRRTPGLCPRAAGRPSSPRLGTESVSRFFQRLPGGGCRAVFVIV